MEAEQFVQRIRSILANNAPIAEGDLDVFGPLLVFEQYQQVNTLLEDLGAFDEDLADSSNDSL